MTKTSTSDIAMSKAYTTGRIGIETLTDSELKYWEKKGVKYRPILVLVT
jgi:hypothetical protein